jgi:hypothetical protein
MKRNNLVGERFGRLVVLDDYGTNKKQNVLWRCMCECGGFAVSTAYDLRKGRVKSCGCLLREGLATKHGMAREGKNRSPTYNVWASMVQRCTNPKDKGYKAYGGRGITVCPKWKKFEGFFADMGECPNGLSLDRRDNDKGYKASNCYWATKAEQARNKRSTVWVNLKGKRVVVKDALRFLGYSGAAIHYQMRTHGLTHQEVIEKWLGQKRRL